MLKKKIINDIQTINMQTKINVTETLVSTTPKKHFFST